MVNLHVHSVYSALDGLLTTSSVAALGKDAGAIAITDHGTCSGHVDFYSDCKNQGVKPLLGVECYYTHLGNRYHATVIAKNIDGYRGILSLQSAAGQKGNKFSIWSMNDLSKIAQDIVLLTGCSTGCPMQLAQMGDIDGLESLLSDWANTFPNLYTEFQPNEEYNSGYLNLLNASDKLGIPNVVTSDIHYGKREDYVLYQDVHRIMTKKEPKLELKWLYPWTDQEMSAYFLNHGFPNGFVRDAVDNTFKVAESCDVRLDFGRKWFFPANPTELLQTCKDRLETILLEKNEEEKLKYLKRFSYEFKVFNDLDLVGYLNFCKDVLDFCRNSGVPYGPGRGSCVGSLVCYLMGITEIDPMEHGLSFDRFLSPSHKTGIINTPAVLD